MNILNYPESAWEDENDDVAGMVEHDLRVAIRDLVRVVGWVKAREVIAFALLDEADRKTPRV